MLPRAPTRTPVCGTFPAQRAGIPGSKRASQALRPWCWPPAVRGPPSHPVLLCMRCCPQLKFLLVGVPRVCRSERTLSAGENWVWATSRDDFKGWGMEDFLSSASKPGPVAAAGRRKHRCSGSRVSCSFSPCGGCFISAIHAWRWWCTFVPGDSKLVSPIGTCDQKGRWLLA